MSRIRIKQGEQRRLFFTVRDAAGKLVDLTDTELLFRVRSNHQTVIEKPNNEFTRNSQGVVSVLLTVTETNLPAGVYVGELRIDFQDADGTIEKSWDLSLEIIRAIT